MLNSQRNHQVQVPIVKTVTGFIKEVPSSADNDDEEYEMEEDDEDGNWLDYSQMKSAFSHGSFVRKGRKPREGRVQLQDFANKKHTCYGRFVLTDAWWDVTVNIGPRNRVAGTVKYSIRKDEELVKRHNLVPMLLTKAYRSVTKELTYEIMEAFEKFVRKYGLTDKLTFGNLESILTKFSNSPNAEHNSCTKVVLSTEIVRTVIRAHKYPELVRFLSQLFPLQFHHCLMAPPESEMPALSRAKDKEPWIFGFSAILASRYRIFGIEASYKAFQAAGMLDDFPPVPKDALFIYEVLKTDAKRDGHTFVPSLDLMQHRHWTLLGHTVSDWSGALAFLAVHKVTAEERICSGRNIFLYHNWKAEVDISRGLGKVMERGITAGRPMWAVDFSSPDLLYLKGDSDQWLAVQKIAASPICILSGKGGCGKTSVVTRLLQHACTHNDRLPAPALKAAKDDEMKDEVAGGNPALKAAKDDEMKDEKTGGNPALKAAKDDEMKDEVAGGNPGLPSWPLPNPEETLLISGTSQSDATQPDGPAHSRPVTQEEITHMIERVTQTLVEESQAEDHRQDDKNQVKGHRHDDKEKRDQLKIDLTTDLLKYLGTVGDTALSRTEVGERILLTAPTGKAAKLLGHKAKMESCTLHRVIYSYRAFVQRRTQNWLRRKREREYARGYDHVGEMGEESVDLGDDCDGEENSSGQASFAGTQDDGAGEGTEGGGDSQRARRESSEDDSDDGGGDADPSWKYAKTEVLVVDECSLVSLRTFATLLNILIENTPLRKIVLLGDVRQLPSIEPGNFLPDVFTTFKERGLSVELRTNHRSESDLIVSNATRISQRQMPFFEPARHFHFCHVEDSRNSADPERDAALRRLLLHRPELSSHVNSQFVAFRKLHCDAINELCCQHYNGHSTQDGQAKSRRNAYNFQIGDKICFRKNGQVMNKGLLLRPYLEPFPGVLEAFGIIKPSNVKAAAARELKERGIDSAAVAQQVMNETGENEDLGEKTNNLSEAESSVYAVQSTEYGIKMEQQSGNASLDSSLSPAEDSRPGRQLRLGDIGVVDGEAPAAPGEGEVPATQPTSSQAVDDEEERAGKLKDGEVRLCNGEVFFIMDDQSIVIDEKEQRYLTLSDRDPECPRVILCTFGSLMRECRMRHAWARTIHTYQGSESDSVVYYVGEAKLQNWKHVYTAVTRGRKSVFIVGKEGELRRAVWERERQRRSRLAHRIKGMMKDVPFQPLHAMVRQVNEQADAALNRAAATVDGNSASALTPCPSHMQSKTSLLDSFPDSDDSWINHMSPVLAAACEDNEDDCWIMDDSEVMNAAGTFSAERTDSYSPGATHSKDSQFSEWRENKPLKFLSPVANTRKPGEVASTKRSPAEYELDLASPPKRQHCADDIDAVVTPVKRKLNI